MAANTALAQQRRVAIIGAGPAGLVTAKTMKDKGFAITVYEKGSVVGGTWVFDNDNGRNFLYRNLHINTSKKLTAFAGLPFDSETQRIPDHRDMARYLAAYARHFDLYPHIRLKSDVVAVRPPAGAHARWSVTTADGAADEFDAVVVCSGPYSRPSHAEEIRGKFTGEYVHSADYRAPEAFVGKRVCIIGAANSAVDVASDICTTSARTVLVARSPVFIMPHFILGREMFDIMAMLQHWWIPAALRKWLIGRLIHAVHGDMTSHGFKPATHRVQATISSTIVQDILFERVTVKQGIRNIEGTEVEFADGAREQFDTIIAATGFIKEFPFLADAIVTAGHNRLDLYKRIVAPGWPGLYFVGMINIDSPINYACERQAQWVAAIESESLALPPEDEMRADISAKHRWVDKTFGGVVRHNFQEDSVRYYGELATVLRQGRRRRTIDAPAASTGARQRSGHSAAATMSDH
jgi:cation diffusion facilitator CzcD-associated flavoprotein CzcO